MRSQSAGVVAERPRTVSRKQKQLAKLDELETTFQEQLVRALRVVTDGGDSLFFLPSEMLPPDYPPRAYSKTTDRLLELADEILALRGRHGLDTEGAMASRFRKACCLRADPEQHHRLGSKRFAERMLKEILSAMGKEKQGDG